MGEADRRITMNSKIIIDVTIAILVIIAAAAVAFFSYRGNKTVIMKMLVAMVTEAEKNLGAGTGSLKLASVISAIYPKLPAILKAFITEATLSKWVEDALTIAKETWQKNVKIAEYIESTSSESE